MKSYIEQILQPGERRLYSGKLHWILFVPGLLLLIAALVFLMLASRSGDSGNVLPRILWLILAALSGAGSAFYLFKAWFERWTTEIEVTDRRIILKKGFIRRETVEMHMAKWKVWTSSRPFWAGSSIMVTSRSAASAWVWSR